MDMTKLLTIAVDVVVTNDIIVHTVNAMERHADASKWLSHDIHKCARSHTHRGDAGGGLCSLIISVIIDQQPCRTCHE
jgi:hypothetical protein